MSSLVSSQANFFHGLKCIMTSLFFRSLASLGRKWKPLSFTKGDFVQIPLMQKVGEETIPGYSTSWYYPAHIGEIIKDRYQIVGKLGFGASSTVWLARDMRYLTDDIAISLNH